MHKFNIRIGDRGEKVKDINTRLKVLGYNASYDLYDFDYVTYGSICSFQNRQMLYETGIVDEETFNNLNKEYIKVINQTDMTQLHDIARSLHSNRKDMFMKEKPEIKDIQEQTKIHNEITKFNKPILRLGYNGEDVKLLQELLYKVGVYKGNIDGVFWIETYKSVKQFQKLVDINMDGVVDLKTWEYLEIYYSNTYINIQD